MQIACERCATVYVLDDKLIPPGGAPVQCTRCGLVFTARPPAPAPVPAPAPAPVNDLRPGTQLFGEGSGAPAPQTHGTQVFGASPAMQAAPGPASVQATQAFGNAPPAASPKPAASQVTQAFGSFAPASSPHATQAFGAIAPPPSAPPARAAPQTSGAIAPPPSAPPAARAATQAFGAFSMPPAAQSAPHATQAFGAIAPPPSAPPPSRAGPQAAPGSLSAPPAAQPSPHATQTFGAIAPPPSAPPQARSATQTFGAFASSPSAQPAPHAPQAFGAIAAQPAPHATQAFGAIAAQPTAQPAPHATQAFGAFTAQPAAQPSPHATQTFGAFAAPAQPAPHATQAFGAVLPASQSAAGSMFGAPPASGTATQMFGAPPNSDPARTSSAPVTFFRKAPAGSADQTLLSSPGEVPISAAGSDDQTLRAGSPFVSPAAQLGGAAAPAYPASQTLLFGGGAASPLAPVPGVDTTLPFGASPFAPAPESQPAAAPGVETTLPFGASYSPAPARGPAGGSPSGGDPAAHSGGAAPEAGVGATMPFGRAPELARPAQAAAVPMAADPAPSSPAAPAAAPAAATAGAPPAESPMAIEPLAASVQMGGAAEDEQWRANPRRAPRLSAAVGSQTMELQAALKKSRMKLPIVLGALALLLLAGGGFYAWNSTRTPMPDPAVLAADLAAFELMQRDDRQSLEAAVAAWAALGAKAPDYVPAKANQMLAHVLLMQDLRDEVVRMQARAQVVEREMVRIKEKKATSDWVARANAKRDEIKKIKADSDPLVDRAKEHDAQAGELLKASKGLAEGTGLDAAAVFRASAVYYAVKSSESAGRLASKYAETPDERGVLHDPQRAFADLAVAALMAQARVSSEMHDKGVAAADKALAKNPKLLRAIFLKARLARAARDQQGADKALAELLALNPQHDGALALRAEAASPAAPEPDSK